MHLRAWNSQPRKSSCFEVPSKISKTTGEQKAHTTPKHAYTKRGSTTKSTLLIKVFSSNAMHHTSWVNREMMCSAIVTWTLPFSNRQFRAAIAHRRTGTSNKARNFCRRMTIVRLRFGCPALDVARDLPLALIVARCSENTGKQVWLKP